MDEPPDYQNFMWCQGFPLGLGKRPEPVTAHPHARAGSILPQDRTGPGGPWSEDVGSDRICSTCGFLCVRRQEHRAEVRYTEVSIEERREGRIIAESRHRDALPVCARFVADIEGELWEAYETTKGQGVTDDDGIFLAAKAVLTKNRNCPEWMQYHPSLGPREHLERRNMMTVEELRDRQTARFAAEDATRHAYNRRTNLIALTIAVAGLVIGAAFAVLTASKDSMLGEWLQSWRQKP
jgi:hypothetical protein